MISAITDLPDTTSLRYERKFTTVSMSKHEVESMVKLHPSMFSEIYPRRFVNNIYLDTHSLASYFDNEDGISERVKTRIRWYNDLFGLIAEPCLEVKTKKGSLGDKIGFPLQPFRLDRNCSLGLLQDTFDRSGLPGLLCEQLKSKECTLLNRYSRKYFESADRKFRITVDFDMEYFAINRTDNSFSERLADREKVILELKYNKKYDDQARFVTNHLPFRLTKSSKYVMGIRLLHRIPA